MGISRRWCWSAVVLAGVLSLVVQVVPAQAQSVLTPQPGDVFNAIGQDESATERSCALTGFGTITLADGAVVCNNTKVSNGNNGQSGNSGTGSNGVPSTTQQKIEAAKRESLGYIPSQTTHDAPGIPETEDDNAKDWRWYFGVPTGEGPTTVAHHLGMYTSPSNGAIDGYGDGGGAVVHGSGYGLTDSAGVLTPGAKAPSLTDVAGSGTIGGSYDASSFLPTGQALLFKGFFNYTNDNLTLGSISGLTAASAGSGRFNTYTLGGSFIYNIGATYLEGRGGGAFGNGSETNAVDGSTGSFNTRGYFADLRIGTIFALLSTGGASPSIPTKAPPKLTGGTVLALDVSGHVGYTAGQIDGFTDSTGFVFGTDRTQFGDVGARVKLFAVVPSNGVLWMPYIAGTVDQLFSYSSTLNIPTQTALPTGDVVGLSQAQTFGGGEVGLDARVPNGWTVGVKGFYTASSDTNIAGGSAYVRIPLTYTPTAGLRY